MAESERIHGSNPTFTTAATTRKRFGSDASAKRFQEALLSLDLFHARSAELPTDLAANVGTSPSIESDADARPTTSDEKVESSDEKEDGDSTNASSSVAESYPLLCNPVGCRAPEGEAVDEEAGLEEKTLAPNSKKEEIGRAKENPNASENGAVVEPSKSPEMAQETAPETAWETAQHQRVDDEPTTRLEPKPTQADSGIQTPNPQAVAAEGATKRSDGESLVSDLQSTKGLEEDNGRERSKPKEDAKSAEEFRTQASVQAVASKLPPEIHDGVAIPADLENSPGEDLSPKPMVGDSDLLPKSRRADRLDRERKSGGNKAESTDPQSGEQSFELYSGGIEAVEPQPDGGLFAEAVVGTDAAISSEITTAGFTEVAGSVMASDTSVSALPAMTISTPQSDLRIANAAGNATSISTEGTTSLGASISSNSGTERAVVAPGASPGASSVRGPLTPFQESKLVQRVLRGFEQLQDGGGQVRLRLHPPELGTLQMTLRIESMQVSARLEVENTVARDALIQNSQTLKDQLAAQGFEVERFEVEIRSEVGGDSSGPEQRSGQRGEESRYQSLESRYAAMQANRISGDGREPLEPAARTTWFRNGNNLDLTV